TINKALESTVRRQLRKWRALAFSPQGRGMAGETQRAVLRALFDIAQKRGSLLVHASVRDLADATHISSLGTISCALRALRTAGWLTKHPSTALLHRRNRPSHEQAYVYELRVPAGVTRRPDTEHSYPQWVDCEEECSELGRIPDLWRWRELGPNGLRVYEALGEQPLSTAALRQM